MPFVVGETIGPYVLLEQLGQGGMAVVFKAYHPALDRYVALKALHPAFSQEPNFLARFRREAQVVARLEHPNIVPVYDFAEHDGRPYLVMKFIEGETLKARLGRGPVGDVELRHIVESVGAALAYAHAQGILHRDVKPSNVLLANDGRIYLADFGLARIAASGESTLSADAMLGTPQYISPEQALGVKDLDEGVDIYSFGVVMYELLVGRTPFNADTPYSVIHDHIYAPLPLPRTLNPNLPASFELFLVKALAKERQDRYPGIGAMLAGWHTAEKEALEADDLLRAARSSTAGPAESLLGAPTAGVHPDLTQAALEKPAPVSPPVGAVEAGRAADPAAPDLYTAIISESRVQRLADTNAVASATAGIDASAPPRSASTVPASSSRSPAKTRPPVWPLLAGLLALGVCALAGVFVLNRIAARRVGVNPTVTASAVIVAPALFTPTPDTPAASPTVALQRAMNFPYLRIAPAVPLPTAIAQATLTPEDPLAYADLAAALWSAGQPAEAHQAMDRAIALVELEPGALLKLADHLTERRAWLAAATLYAQALRRPRLQLDQAQTDNAYQAFYMAAAYPDAQDLIHRLPENRVNADLRALFIARADLYNNPEREPQQILFDLRGRHPALAEISLLEAEVFYVDGRLDDALQALNRQASAAGAPSWAVLTARTLQTLLFP